MRPGVRGQGADYGRFVAQARRAARFDAGLLRSRVHAKEPAIRADARAEQPSAQSEIRLDREDAPGRQIHDPLDDRRRKAIQPIPAYRQRRTAGKPQKARSFAHRRSGCDFRQGTRTQRPVLKRGGGASRRAEVARPDPPLVMWAGAASFVGLTVLRSRPYPLASKNSCFEPTEDIFDEP